MPRFELSGKTALITGGMRGIGFETAKALRARGARVTITDLDEAAVERAARQIGGDDVLGLRSNVRDEASLRAAVERTVERFGSLDVVVANAGIAPPPRTFLALDPEEFDHVLDVNLRGVVHTVRAALPEIVAARGQIVLISSVYAFTLGVLMSPYATAKAGVEALGRALRVELRSHGVSVAVAYFGFIDTQMVAEAREDPVVQKLDRTIPRPLRKTFPPSVAAEGIARAVERRAAHVLLPRRWEPLRALRGIVGPASDAVAGRHPTLQPVLREVDAGGGPGIKCPPV